MKFCVQLPNFIRGRGLNKKQKKYQSQPLFTAKEYESLRRLFEQAKAMKAAQSDTENIHNFIEKYCLDDFKTLEEESDSNKDLEETRDSFEDTVSWEYFDVSDNDSQEQSLNSTPNETSSNPNLLDETNCNLHLSFHCSTLRQTFNESWKKGFKSAGRTPSPVLPSFSFDNQS